MLNEADIEFMHDSQDEIYELRRRPINVISFEEQYDDFTGELVGGREESRSVSAVITEISTRSMNGSRYIESGIEFEQGDIEADIKIEAIEDISVSMKRLEFDGKQYEILGFDRKGIGRRNRYEIIGRVIA